MLSQVYFWEKFIIFMLRSHENYLFELVDVSNQHGEEYLENYIFSNPRDSVSASVKITWKCNTMHMDTCCEEKNLHVCHVYGVLTRRHHYP